MQAILEKPKTLNENVDILLSKLENADNKIKNDIENKLVRMGEGAVEELIHQLQTLKGTSRGVVAMSIIRIGECAVECLKREAQINREFEWVADYLISEINCEKTRVA